MIWFLWPCVVVVVVNQYQVLASIMKVELIGGKTPRDDAHRWMASLRLGRYDQGYCGGVVINANQVLTAGHCCVDHVPEFVAIGSRELRQVNDSYIYAIAKTDVHPGYLRSNTSLVNDLALLTLARPVVTGLPKGRVSFPRLATETDEDVNTRVEMLGWGVTNETLFQAPKLQFISMKTMTISTCMDRIRLSVPASKVSRLLPQEHLCAAALRTNDSKGGGICHGDSGGPLFYHTSDEMVIVGIASFVVNGCSSRKKPLPDVFTRVKGTFGELREK